MTAVDPDKTVFTVAADIVIRTTELIAEPGREGFEGSAVWIGAIDAAGNAFVTRLFRPEQTAYSTRYGLAVEVTETGLTDLIGSLKPGELVLARLHTHGNGDVKHSTTDDRNLLVAHPGAVSIVVPWFAEDGIDLNRCGVHILRADHRWRRMSAREIRRRFRIA